MYEEVGYIPLTQGQVAIVDAKYVDELMRYRWSTSGSCSVKNHPIYYAVSRGGHKGKLIRMHRYVYKLEYGYWPNGPLDHINHNSLDNRVSNLRITTNRRNIQNSFRRAAGLTSSQYPGVYYQKHNNIWVAQIYYAGARYGLGCYKVEVLAGLAYQVAFSIIEFVESHQPFLKAG